MSAGRMPHRGWLPGTPAVGLPRALAGVLAGVLAVALASGCSAGGEASSSSHARAGTAPSAAGGRLVAYVSLRGDGRIAVFDVDWATGEWAPKQTVEVREGEAGWVTSAPIAVSPDRRRLDVGMRGEGAVATYAIDDDGRLSLVGTVPIGGSAPFLSRDRTGRWLLAAYYPEGKVTVHRIGEDGAVAGQVQEIVTALNAHSIMPDPSNRFVLVPHTGPNAIYRFAFDAETGTLTAADPALVHPPAGREPRHHRYHPLLPIVYVINEAGSSITVYRFDPDRGTLDEIQDVPTIPGDYSGANSTADLHTTPDGRFLYGSNRGHDSLAAYRVDPATGRLDFIDWFETEPTPRSFAIDPGGRFLYAAGQGSGNVAAYEIHPDSGGLTRFATFSVGPAPTWIELVELD
jgi:6-phosphogluconolactonase